MNARPEVLIIGTGLIGTSIGMALTTSGYVVHLRDQVPGQAFVAREMGAGQLEESGVIPQIVVVAVPPRYAPQVIASASREYPKATVTDVCSVKEHVLSQAVALGADPSRLVGGHPMAGREVSGATGARVGLMSDRVWIITPGLADEWRIEVVTDLAIACGAQPLRMDARTHDVAVARVSHAAQILASVLAASLLDTPEDHISVAGQGLRDMTRLAASNVGLWTDIVTANAEPIAEVLDEVIGSLQEIRSALRPDSNRGGDPEACAAEIRQVLVKGNDGVARLPGKHGRDATHFQTVAVMLVDQPGELARLFAASGTAGINTEDVRIEHILGRPSGLVELFVAPDQAPALRQVLIERGFDVRT